MPRRPAANPPRLPGYEAVELIGSGGHADVFLYRQAQPDRMVAVKVLAPDAAAEAGLVDFTDEANLMAQVSSHPYIVQVFEADVSDDGRPFLVMEYYPGPNFYDRARHEQIAISEVLQTGVHLASAVETAHNAHILHRDIKPANVLTDRYNRPGLADFGIASRKGPQGQTADSALSIPWAPPEALGGDATGESSDTYALAATLYTLLAGRSPFEISGGDNGELALMARIERDPVPPTGRPDVPRSLERVLAVAMAKDASHRPISAAQFGRQLQEIESELKLAVTRLDIEANHTVKARTERDDEQATIHTPGVIDAQPQSRADLISGMGSAPSGQVPLPPRDRHLPGEPPVPDTVHRSGGRVGSEPVPYQAPGLSPIYVWAGAAVLVVALIIAATQLIGAGEDGSDDETPVDFAVNDGFDSPIAVAPPSVESIAVADNGDGRSLFTWDSPAESVEFIVTEVGVAGPVAVTATEFVSAAECIEVETKSSSGLLSAPTRGCS